MEQTFMVFKRINFCHILVTFCVLFRVCLLILLLLRSCFILVAFCCHTSGLTSPLVTIVIIPSHVPTCFPPSCYPEVYLVSPFPFVPSRALPQVVLV